MGAAGQEWHSKTSEKQGDSTTGNTQNDAPDKLSINSDPNLARLIEVWSSLPPAVRAGIKAMVEASAPRG